MRLIFAALGLGLYLAAAPSYAIDDAEQQGIPVISVQHTMQGDVAAQAGLSTAQAARYHQLIELYRCPKCQNANLAGSDAPIAQDLKHKILLQVQANKSDDEIRDYLVTRYGEFISYQPSVKPATWLLWFLPPVLLLCGLIGWMLHTRQRQTTAPLSSEERWRLAQVLALSTDHDTAQAARKQEAADDHQ